MYHTCDPDVTVLMLSWFIAATLKHVAAVLHVLATNLSGVENDC